MVSYDRWLSDRRALRCAVLTLAAAAGVAALLQRDGGAGSAMAATGQTLASAEIERTAAQRASLCSTASIVGVGLLGRYFADERLGGALLLERVDSTVDFGATLDWPADREARKPHSVRWTGWIKPPLGGRYRFHAGNPGARVTVAKQLLAGGDARADASIELAAGRFYPITVEVFSLKEAAGPVKLEWTVPHGARYVVPRSLLHPPSDSGAGRS